MTERLANRLSRRQWMRQFVGVGLSLPFTPALLASPLLAQASQQPAAPPDLPAGQYVLSPDDEQFLLAVETTSFQFFWEQQNPKTGLVQDRCDLRGGTPGVVASIAATGFGLTALCIGEKSGLVSRTAALERIFATLNFL